jgi:hypothetical protein
MYDLIDKGSIEEEGYNYKMYLITPVYSRNRVEFGEEMYHTLVSFPTKFLLTSANYYCKIELSLFGFGLGLSIATRRS